MNEFASLGHIIEKSLDDLGLFQKARKYQVYVLWPRLVGELSKHAFPRRIDGDTLYVATSSSVWSQELTFMAPEILSKVNNALGGQYFREIRFSEHLWRAAAREGSRFAESAGPKRSGPRGQNRDRQEKDLDRVLVSLKATMRRRVAELKAKGYKTCEKCGYLFPPGKNECPMCEARRELYQYNSAVALLERHPDLTDDAVSQTLGITDLWLVQRARDELDSRWSSFIRSSLAQSDRKERKSVEMVETVAKLLALRSGKTAEGLTQREISEILGKRLAAILKKE